MEKWRNSLKQMFSSQSSEQETPSCHEIQHLEDIDASFPKEESEPPHFGSTRLGRKNTTNMKKCEWAKRNLADNLTLDKVNLRKWSRDQMELMSMEKKPEIRITLSNDESYEQDAWDENSSEPEKLFGRSISLASSSGGSDSDAMNKVEENSDSESEGCITPIADHLNVSTVTLTPVGTLPEGDESDVYIRLIELFKKDLEQLYHLITNEMPDHERRKTFLEDLNKYIRSLKTAVTINTHFLILSSVSYE